MSRTLQLRGDTAYQLQTLKEACEMEGSRMVTLRADELLAFILVFAEAPEGVEIVVSADLQTQVDDRDAKIVELEGLLAAANGDIESLKAKLLDAEQRIVLYVRGESEAAEKILTLTNEVALLKLNRAKVDKELEDLKFKADVEGNSLVDVANERDELRSKLSAAESELANTKGVLEDEQREKANQAATIIAFQTKIPELEAAFKAKDTEHAADLEKLKASEGANAALTAKISELEAKLAPFQAALAAAAPKPADPPPATNPPAP